MNGGREKRKYYVWGGLFDEDGIRLGCCLGGYNVGGKVEKGGKEWLKVGRSRMVGYEEREEGVDGDYGIYGGI